MSDRVDTHLVERPDQRQALSSPLRLEILGLFISPGGMSIAEVAERMGRPASALYYHFRLLERVGLLRRCGTRPGAKRAEVLYEPIASRFALAARRESKSSTRAALKAVSAAFRMAERDMEAALTSAHARTQGRHRNTFATRMHCRITKTTLAAINKHLDALERILMRESRRRHLPPDADQFCSLTIALLPLRGRGSPENPE